MERKWCHFDTQTWLSSCLAAKCIRVGIVTLVGGTVQGNHARSSSCLAAGVPSGWCRHIGWWHCSRKSCSVVKLLGGRGAFGLVSSHWLVALFMEIMLGRQAAWRPGCLGWCCLIGWWHCSWKSCSVVGLAVWCLVSIGTFCSSDATLKTTAPHFRENTVPLDKGQSLRGLATFNASDAGRFKEVKSLSFYQVYPWIVGRF